MTPPPSEPTTGRSNEIIWFEARVAELQSKLVAAEQREREAGAKLAVLAQAAEAAILRVPSNGGKPGREHVVHRGWKEHRQSAPCEVCAALAAIRCGPAQPAEPRSLFGWIGRRIGDHVQTADCDGTCLDCIDGGYGSDGLVKSAPAPVSDPPTARIAATRCEKCGNPYVSIPSMGIFHPCVPVADPTETER